MIKPFEKSETDKYINKKFNPFFINSTIVINDNDIKNIETFRKSIYYNIGNSYITYSIMKLICGGVYDAPRINNMHYFNYDNGKLIDFINNEISHVIFILEDYIRAYTLEFPEHLLEFLKKIKKPIIVMSLGSNNIVNGQFDNDFVSKLSKEKIFFLKELSNLTESLGVRGYRTVETLNKLGIYNCEAVGCPSYFVKGANRIVEKKPYDTFKLALGGTLFNTNIDNVSYILQDELELIEILYFDKKQLSYNFHYNIDYISLYQKRYVAFSNCNEWENYLKDFTMYLGTRMHGAIVSLNAGIPAIVMNQDSRAEEMCELFKIPYMPNLLKKSLINAKFLYDIIDLGAMNKNYNELYNNFINWLKKFDIELQSHKFNYIKQPSIKLLPDNIIKNRCINLINLKLKIKEEEHKTAIINLQNKNNDLRNEINNEINDLYNFTFKKINEDKNWIKLFGFYNTKDYLIFYLFGIKITFKMNEKRINNLAWWIPVRKLRDKFRNKFRGDK